MIKNSIAIGTMFIALSVAGLYAQKQTPQAKPVLTEKAVKGVIKNHEKLLEGINVFQADTEPEEAQWLEAFQIAFEEDPNQAGAFLKKNPPPKKLQAIFRQYGLDRKTGILQIMVIAYVILVPDYEDADFPVPFKIHPDDIKLVEKYRKELSQILRPAPVEAGCGSDGR